MKYLSRLFLLMFAVSFFAACSDDDGEEAMDQVDDQQEETTMVEYTDLEFSQNPENEAEARFFSTSSGEMYSLSELDATTGATVDLAWYGSQSTFIFFESPDDLFNDDQTVPSAKSTKIQNYDVAMTVEEFDSIEDDTLLKDLQVTHDQNAIGTLDFPVIVLFETAEGKKGAIKLKAINSSRLLADVKVMK